MAMERKLSLHSGLKQLNEGRIKCDFNLNCACQPSATETREFRKRWLLLTDRERVTALSGDANQFLKTATDLLLCPGCRNSAEALFYKLVDGIVRLPQIVSRSGLCFDKDNHFRLSESCVNSPDKLFSLFYHQEQWANTTLMKPTKSSSKAGTSRARCQLHSQRVRGRPRPAAFEALWHKLPEDHQRHLSHIDSDQFLTDLENYLRRHRFCCRCKEKVLEAYDLLVGSSCSEDDCEDCGGFECAEKHHEHSDYGDDLHYTSYLFDELAFSRATNQIIVPCNIEFMLQLMSRADQEVAGDYWGDRHARTIAEAQDEVLMCLGMVIWDKMQSLWTKTRTEKRSEELVVHCALSTLRRNFDVALEALHGEAMIEQLLAEEDDESRRMAKKKEKRKEKKKKRKSVTKLKQRSRSESEKSCQCEKQKPKPTKARKQSDSSKTMTSQSSTNSLSSQEDDDDLTSCSRSTDVMGTHQCDSTCDEPCERGTLTYDERMEWQLLSSMGWNASNQITPSLPELDVDTDDENHGIPEDEIRFWKQNRSSLVRRRMAQRQELQERFDQFVLRTTSLDG
ncbi:unnamed protein product [Peronospora farinosa]|uniref:Gametogenetin-binding protein 2 n=1 Tax=Peronospora farinosa TaxID=134698 RepID=A0AAV0UL82_9STRA|nr:unnamed protein product [Peronospora farinosa]CAI5736279.1 unnamed protein product [Peronospora farinosa]